MLLKPSFGSSPERLKTFPPDKSFGGKNRPLYKHTSTQGNAWETMTLLEGQPEYLFPSPACIVVSNPSVVVLGTINIHNPSITFPHSICQWTHLAAGRVNNFKDLGETQQTQKDKKSKTSGWLQPSCQHPLEQRHSSLRQAPCTTIFFCTECTIPHLHTALSI